MMELSEGIVEGAAVNRIPSGGIRWYSPLVEDDVLWEDRVFAPSVTSIQQITDKGPWFLKWCINKFPNDAIRHEYMQYLSFTATVAHKYIDLLIRGGYIDLSIPAYEENADTGEHIDISRIKYKKPLQGFLMAFMKFWKDEKIIRVLGSETMLWTPEYGGTADCIAVALHRNKESNNMYDWKMRQGPPMTGDHPAAVDHGEQLTGYSDAWDENYPDFPIARRYNVYFGEGGGYLKRYRDYVPEGWRATYNHWMARNAEAGVLAIPKEPKVLPTIFSLTEKDEENE